MDITELAPGMLVATMSPSGYEPRPALILATPASHPERDEWRPPGADLIVVRGHSDALAEAIAAGETSMTIAEAKAICEDLPHAEVDMARSEWIVAPWEDAETLALQALREQANRGFVSSTNRWGAEEHQTLRVMPQSHDYGHEDDSGLLISAARTTREMSASAYLRLDDDDVRELHAYLGAYLATTPGGPAENPVVQITPTEETP